MIVEELKKSILNYAISGNLTIQNEKFLVDEKLEDFRDELSFNIPKNWKCVKLSNISDYGKNISVCGKNIDNESWVLELEDIEKNSGILLRKVYQKERKAVSNKNKFSKGNVLYGKLRPYLNKCYIADEDGYCSTEIVPMKLDKNVINKYLQLVLMSPYFLNYVNEKSYGTKMPRLGTKDAQNSLIPLPPIEEQQRIVDKIEELFAKLSEIKPIEEELKFLKDSFPNDMINSILNDAYTGKLINQNTSVWNSNKLIDCCKEIVTGNSISESIKKSKYTNIKEGYNYIATKDLEFNHTFNYDNGIKIPFDEKGFKYAKEDDILLCIEGGSAGKKIGILNETVCYGNKLCRFSTNQNVLSKFLYYYLQSPIFLKNFNSNLSGIIGGVSINKIKNIELKYPSIEVQQRIVDKIEQLLPLCNNIEKLISE